MPKDRKVILVAGCLFNPHCRVHVIGKNFPLAHELTAYLMNHEVGVITYHCPEFTSGGFNRNPQGMIQYDNVFFRKHCEEVLDLPMNMIQEFLNNGYRLTAVIGLQNSPSCGVAWKAHKFNKYGEESWMESGEETNEVKKGIMMQVIERRLANLELHNIPFIEFPTSATRGTLEHSTFWYEVRKAIEPRNPYVTIETASDFHAYFIKTNHHNDPSVPYVEQRPSKIKEEQEVQ